MESPEQHIPIYHRTQADNMNRAVHEIFRPDDNGGPIDWSRSIDDVTAAIDDLSNNVWDISTTMAWYAKPRYLRWYIRLRTCWGGIRDWRRNRRSPLTAEQSEHQDATRATVQMWLDYPTRSNALDAIIALDQWQHPLARRVDGEGITGEEV